MNSIRKVKIWWRRTDSAKQKEEVLSSIPESRLPGINALPAEIWGLVLEHVVVSEMEALRLREWQLAHILRYRMVCRLFDKEVQYALHHNLVLIHLPPVSRGYHMTHRAMLQIPSRSLRCSLLASALYNSVQARTGSARGPRIVARLRNCKIIAESIPSSYELHGSKDAVSCLFGEDESPLIGNGAKSLLRRLCVAASTSYYCHLYIYTYKEYSYLFDSGAMGNLYLEAALLVACGYALEDVKVAMVKLALEGKLVGHWRNSYSSGNGMCYAWGFPPNC